MASSDQVLAVTAGFLQSFARITAEQDMAEKNLLVNSIQTAVERGTPEALDLLNPQKLTYHRLDGLIPTYKGIAQEMKKFRTAELQRTQALARTAEVEATVGEQTQQAKIRLGEAQATQAEQKVQMGQWELLDEEKKQEILRENPELRKLPFQQVQAGIQNIESQITARTADTAQGWKNIALRGAELGQRAKQFQQELAFKERALEETITERRERTALTVQERAEQRVERAESREKTDLMNTMSKLNTNMLGVQKNIAAKAKAADRTPGEYDTKEEAESDAAQLNSLAAQFNTYVETWNKNPERVRQEPQKMYEVVTKPSGILGLGKKYHLVEKQEGLGDLLREMGIEVGALGQRPTGGARVEQPTPSGPQAQEAPTGRRVAPEGRAARRGITMDDARATAEVVVRRAVNREPSADEIEKVATGLMRKGGLYTTASEVLRWIGREPAPAQREEPTRTGRGALPQRGAR